MLRLIVVDSPDQVTMECHVGELRLKLSSRDWPGYVPSPKLLIFASVVGVETNADRQTLLRLGLDADDKALQEGAYGRYEQS